MFGNASKLIFENAKELRSNMTETEIMLWEKLRNNQFHGYKFRRQHPFDSYVLDFYCHEARVAIEIDGSIHDENEQKEYDNQRSNALELAGIHVIRFKNKLVKENIDEVLKQIYTVLTQN